MPPRWSPQLSLTKIALSEKPVRGKTLPDALQIRKIQGFSLQTGAFKTPLHALVPILREKHAMNGEIVL